MPRGKAQFLRSTGEKAIPEFQPSDKILGDVPTLTSPVVTFSYHSRADNRILNRVLDQLRASLKVKLFHHRVLVKSDRTRRQIQDCRHLFHRTALSQQLKYFLLSQSELVSRLFPLEILYKRTNHPLCDKRSNIRTPRKGLTNGKCQFGCCAALQEITGRSQLKCFRRKIGILVHCQV